MKVRETHDGAAYPHDKGIWLSVAVFVLLAIGIAVLAIFYYQHRAQQVRAEKQAHLGETLQLKVTQIVQWRRELMNDALIIQGNPFLSTIMEEWVENPNRRELTKEIERWLQVRHQTERYLSISLVDSQGHVLLAVPEGMALLDEGTSDSLSIALHTGQVKFSDLHRATPGGEIIVEIIVPLLLRKAMNSPSPGAIILRVDAETFLFPLIQSWPASVTAEVILVRREGNNLLVLNELRHRKHAALSLQSPLMSPGLTASDSALGKGDLYEGIDYRGIPVVATTRAVPGSPWFVVAKLDEEEIYASLRRNLGFVLLLAFSLIMLAGISAALLQRRTLATYYRRLYELGKEKSGLDQSLLVSEAKYQDLIENIRDVVVTLDEQGVITFASPVLEKMLGYDPSEVIGRNQWEFVHPDDIPLVKARFEVMKNGFSQENEYRVAAKNGETRWIRTSSRPVYKEGDLKCFYIVLRDITPRKRAEDELRESEERFRRFSAAAFEGIVLHEGGVLLSANDQYYEMFGYEPEELLEKQALPLTVAPEALESMRKEIAKGGVGPYESIGLKKDGTRFPMEIRVREAEYKGRKVRVAAIMNITERKKAKDDARIMDEDRQRMEAHLRQAQKMEAIGTLAGGIAHDFNNTLGAILGYTEMAMMEVPQEDKAHYYLERVLKASERAKDLVKQILTFSRQSKKELRPLGVGTVLKEALKLLRPSLPSFIEIRREIKTEQDIILADFTQIHQVVMNLCTNAAHAMREKGGVLTVGLRSVRMEPEVGVLSDPGLKPGKYLELTVSDTGHGIEEGVMPRIFEPYFTTKKPGEGTGMGLAMVHGIVKGHGGAIKVESSVGKGTVFHVYLPVTEEAEKSLGIESSLPTPQGKGMILFVDDEAPLAEVGTLMLSNLGYEVVTRTSSPEALEVFRATPDQFDMVITDTTMPKMTGLDLAGEIMKLRPAIPVILCTGYSDLVDTEKAGTIGIRELLMKPLASRQLAEAVKRAMGE
jgi:PAS domain S-box-containing protein